MTKKKKTDDVNSLFNQGFEIEGQENEKKEDNEESPFGEPTVIETKVEKTKVIEPVAELSNEFVNDIDKTFNVFDFEKQSSELFSLSKKLSLIKDDEDNQAARDLAKQMTTLKNKIEEARKEANKPDQQRIDGRMESAKKITEPLTKELDRLKQCVSFYESEKERKRLEEKKKLEDEIKAKEEKEKKERERVQKIRSEIDRLRTDGQAKVNACNTLKEVNDLEVKLKGWKLKPEFFAEFIEEAEGLKNEISELLSQRKPLIEEIEKNNLEAEKLKGDKKLQAEKEAEAKKKELEAQNKLQEEEQRNKQLQEQNMELAAKQELIVLVASFGMSRGVEEYMENVIAKYGNCRLAMEQRDKLVDDYREHLSNKTKMDAIDSEKVKNVRLTFEFSIIDEDLIPREFLSVDEAKIRKALVDNRKKLEEDVNGYKIDGLLIYPKKSIIVK